MGRIFGTDGVRGVAGRELTAQLAMELAMAAVPVLADRAGRPQRPGRPVAVIGRDSRASGDFLEAAVVAGLTSAGIPQEQAVAAVFIQRLFTAYLPPIWGWFTLAWMRRREYI